MSFEYQLRANAQRVWDATGRAPWLVTFTIFPQHACHQINIYAFPQTRCVIDDFGSLVMVEPIR